MTSPINFHGLKKINLESGVPLHHKETSGITFFQTVNTPSQIVYQADFSPFLGSIKVDSAKDSDQSGIKFTFWRG